MTGDLGSEIVPRFMADPTAGPEKQAMQMALLKQLELVIAEELTERQRRALIAVYVHGMPLEKLRAVWGPTATRCTNCFTTHAGGSKIACWRVGYPPKR